MTVSVDLFRAVEEFVGRWIMRMIILIGFFIMLAVYSCEDSPPKEEMAPSLARKGEVE